MINLPNKFSHEYHVHLCTGAFVFFTLLPLQAGPLTVEREFTLSAVVNGNQRAGMVALNKAVELASAKAKQHGVGVVSTYNTSTSTGMLACYAETLGKVNKLEQG